MPMPDVNAVAEATLKEFASSTLAGPVAFGGSGEARKDFESSPHGRVTFGLWVKLLPGTGYRPDEASWASICEIACSRYWTTLSTVS